MKKLNADQVIKLIEILGVETAVEVYKTARNAGEIEAPTEPTEAPKKRRKSRKRKDTLKNAGKKAVSEAPQLSEQTIIVITQGFPKKNEWLYRGDIRKNGGFDSKIKHLNTSMHQAVRQGILEQRKVNGRYQWRRVQNVK